MNTFIINLNDTTALSDSVVAKVIKLSEACQPVMTEAETNCYDVAIVGIICAAFIIIAWFVKCTILSWKDKTSEAADNERQYTKDKEKEESDRKREAEKTNHDWRMNDENKKREYALEEEKRKRQYELEDEKRKREYELEDEKRKRQYMLDDEKREQEYDKKNVTIQ